MRRLDFEDFSKIVHLANIRISPDDKLVSFVTIRSDLEKNRYNYEIWIKDLNTLETVAVLSSDSKDYDQVWFNNKSLLFLSRRGSKEDEKGNAIFYYPLFSEPRQIFRSDKGINSIRVTKEGNIAFSSPWTEGKTDEDYVTIEDFLCGEMDQVSQTDIMSIYILEIPTQVFSSK